MGETTERTGDGGGDPGPVVVAVDPSDSARAAAMWAADLAADQRAPLRLVHVVPGAPHDAPVVPVPTWMVELEDAAVRSGVEECTTEVLAGGTVELIADRARPASLLVLGSYGEGAWSGMLAGSVALALLDTVACPVAVVRGPAPQLPPPRGGPVVAGVDGSAAGRAALVLAAELAATLGARLVAVHTWADVVAGPDGSAHRRSEDHRTLAAEAASLLDAELAAVTAAHPRLPVERDVVEDTPLRALLARAADARMLVVGRRGHTAGEGVLLGSTSRSLVEFAPCPVLVTRPAGEAASPVPGSAQSDPGVVRSP